MCVMQAKFQSNTWPKVNFLHRTTLSNLIKKTVAERIDHKFCVPETLLKEFLNFLNTEKFSVIEFQPNIFQNKYQTVYFDTPDFKNFHDHRCGKLPREKFRWRKYGDSEDEFLEKKRKLKN